MENKPQSMVLSLVLTGLVCALIFGYLGYYLGQMKTGGNPDAPIQVYTTSTPTVKATSAATPAPTTSASATVSAATSYNDSDFGIAFDIPSGYIAVKRGHGEGLSGNTITIAKKEGDKYTDQYITITYNKDTSKFADFLAAEEKALGSDLISKETTTIGGKEGRKIKLGGLSDGIEYLTATGTLTFNAKIYPSSDANSVLDSIVKSVKFTK